MHALTFLNYFQMTVHQQWMMKRAMSFLHLNRRWIFQRLGLFFIYEFYQSFHFTSQGRLVQQALFMAFWDILKAAILD